MRVLLLSALASLSIAPGSARSLRAQKLRAANRAKGWRECAAEGAALPSGGIVSFGWGMAWVEAELSEGATCSVDTFGSDPVPGIRKVCQCADDASAENFGEERTEAGVQWERCASEGQLCQCESGTMRFGNGARWVVGELGQDAANPERQCNAQALKHEGTTPASERRKLELWADSTEDRSPRECWCEVASPRRPPAKVAIVLLSRRPFDIKTWFQYHLDYMGIDHIFMQVEDTPDFNTTLHSMSPAHQQRITAWTAAVGSKIDNRPSDDYSTLQQRQMTAMRHAHSEAARMGIDWLIHTDDDELLYTPTHRAVGDVLAAMPDGYDQAYMPNVEAIYPSAEVQNCFTETTEFNSNVYSFVSYANGKAAVRVSNLDAQPAGPHQWRTPEGLELNSIHLDKESFGAPLMVVHYESCPFKRWETKYWELGNTSPEKVRAIPFPFYKDSISRMQQCVGSEQERRGVVTDGQGVCSQGALKQLWSSYKTTANPHIRRQDLVAIDIPWAAIQKKDF